MQPRFSTGILIGLTALISGQATAASITLSAKEAESSSSTKYTYSYTCSNGSTGAISVSATNDKTAKDLAEKKASRVCEETR
ncbi:MAG: hypothetical protein AB7F79_05490 [Steroidobacteraceae bacterium]